MKLVFSDDQFPQEVTMSLFLQGPSPRNPSKPDWKHDAVELLKTLNFTGTVFIPVPRDRFLNRSADISGWTYDGQVEWEVKARQRADLIVCWVARRIDIQDPHLGMPGFTTNVEFGEDLTSGKLVYGRPDIAEKVTYLDHRIEMLNQARFTTLEQTLKAAIDKLGTGAYRTGGEAAVPLFIWNTPQFKSWYTSLKTAGNRLDDAKLLHHVSFRSGGVFCYMLWVKIWVEAEQRHKPNEFVISRTDVSNVVAYCRDEATGHLQVALVKEFRSTVNNNIGFVFEFSGGSSTKPGVDPRLNAHEELSEEMGLDIADLSRFLPVGDRQLASTVLTHRVQAYKIELARAEMDQLIETSRKQSSFGADEFERTYVVITDVRDIFKLPVDYSTLGMLFEALAPDLPL